MTLHRLIWRFSGSWPPGAVALMRRVVIPAGRYEIHWNSTATTSSPVEVIFSKANELSDAEISPEWITDCDGGNVIARYPIFLGSGATRLPLTVDLPGGPVYIWVVSFSTASIFSPLVAGTIRKIYENRS